MNKLTIARLAIQSGIDLEFFQAGELYKFSEAVNQQLQAEINNLHTVMMAAAVEITEHWDAHCDDEGYGPSNLVRRLENGFPEQYGYDAKTVVQLEGQKEQLQAERDAAIEYVKKLEAVIRLNPLQGGKEKAGYEALASRPASLVKLLEE